MLMVPKDMKLSAAMSIEFVFLRDTLNVSAGVLI